LTLMIGCIGTPGARGLVTRKLGIRKIASKETREAGD